LPQAINNVFSALVSELLSVLKDSSILSAIGLMELTKIAMNMSARTLDLIGAYVLITVVYLFIAAVISFGAKLIEKKLAVEA
jgi:ABC-type amino acid transport system permease subunit